MQGYGSRISTTPEPSIAEVLIAVALSDAARGGNWGGDVLPLVVPARVISPISPPTAVSTSRGDGEHEQRDGGREPR